MYYYFLASPLIMKSDIVVSLSLLFAFSLYMLPLPGWAMLARPELPLLVYLYWVLSVPHRYGIAVGAFVGFLQDIFTGAFIGTHIVLYAVLVASFLVAYRQVRMQSLWWQALTLVPFLLLLQCLRLALQAGQVPLSTSMAFIFLPTLSSMLIWPWLMLSLRSLRRHFNIVNQFT